MAWLTLKSLPRGGDSVCSVSADSRVGAVWSGALAGFKADPQEQL